MPSLARSASPRFHHGYFSGDGYTYNAYPDYFPQHLSLVSLIAGQRPPRLDQPFRLVEFGCGQGVGLCLQAALHPHASFTGIDVLASHISHGRQLACDAELSNVQFQDADLIALARKGGSGSASASGSTSGSGPLDSSRTADGPAAGSVDLAVCHGVLSWVSREVQQSIWQLSSSCLRPGGLLAISYNAFPGTLSAVPFQHLVRSLQHLHASGSASLEAAIEISQGLQQCGAGLFSAQPTLKALLDNLPSQDPDYLPHEYNQQHWQPRFCDAVIRTAAGHGLSFLASATLTDAFEGLLPPAFRELLAPHSDPGLRQLLRDLLVNTSFRRDVFARGPDRLWPLEAQQALGEIRIQRLISPEQLEQASPEELFRFNLSFGSVQGNPGWFGSFLQALGPEPRCIAELTSLEGIGPLPLAELLQNLALLMQQGLVAQLAVPVDPAACLRLNRVLAARIRAGAPYRHLAAPLIGGCLGIDGLDGLALAAHLDGHSGAGLAAALDANLRDLGREVQQDGRTLAGQERADFLRRQGDQFLLHTLPRLQRLGAVA